MRKPIELWKNTFAKLGVKLWRRRSQRAAFKYRTMRIQELVQRRMLATDLAIEAFCADGQDLQVVYDVAGEAATAFEVGVYRSSDGIIPEELVASQTVSDPAKLSVAEHSISIDASFADVEEDYYLLAKLDIAESLSELHEDNNQAELSSGVFLAAGGTLHVHGSNGSDNVYMDDLTHLNITVAGIGSYSYDAASVSGIHVRLHDGFDMVKTSLHSTEWWAFDSASDEIIPGSDDGTAWTFIGIVPGEHDVRVPYVFSDDGDSSDGSGTASGTGSGAASGEGSAAASGEGSAAASGEGSATASGEGSAAASGEGSATASGEGSAAASGEGSATASGEGSATASGEGSAAASGEGSATASGEGSAAASGEGSAAASGEGSATASGEGSAAASGEGSATASGEGSAAASGEGSGAASGEGSATASGEGSAAASGEGSATASGEGSAAASGEGSGAASGEGSGAASGEGSAAASGEGSAAASGEGSGTASGEGSAAASGEGSGTASGIASGEGEVVAADWASGLGFDWLSNPDRTVFEPYNSMPVFVSASLSTFDSEWTPLGTASVDLLTLEMFLDDTLMDGTTVYPLGNFPILSSVFRFSTGIVSFNGTFLPLGQDLVMRRDEEPFIFLGDDRSIVEGSVFSSSGLAADSVSADWTLSVDYDDGSGLEPLPANDDGTFNLTHVYVDDGEYAVKVVFQGEDAPENYDEEPENYDEERYNEELVSVTVVNVPPIFTIDGASSINEDNTYTLGLSSSDSGSDSITSWNIHWGDGAIETVSGSEISVTHGFARAGTFVVTATGTSDEGTYQADPITVCVSESNVPPTANVGGSYAVTEGGSLLLLSSASFDENSNGLYDDDTWTNPSGSHTVLYEWDLDGDNIYGETGSAALMGDETARMLARPDDQGSPRWHLETLFQESGSTAPAMLTVGLRVTDPTSTVTYATTTIDVLAPVPLPAATVTPPQAGDDAFECNGLNPLVLHYQDLTANDSNPAGGALTVELASQPSVGTVTHSPNGSFTYTPENWFDGPVTFEYRLINSSGATDLGVVTITQNHPPTVDVGGPYEAWEGGYVTLFATATVDDNDPSDSLTYAWDFDNDGIYGESSESVAGVYYSHSLQSGRHAVFNATEADGPSQFVVGLQVTDSRGLSATGTATIVVNNVPPTIRGDELVGVLTSPIHPIAIGGYVRDPVFHRESITATVDYGDGTAVQSLALDPDDGTFQLSHLYDTPGNYLATVTADDGQEASTRNVNIWVTGQTLPDLHIQNVVKVGFNVVVTYAVTAATVQVPFMISVEDSSGKLFGTVDVPANLEPGTDYTATIRPPYHDVLSYGNAIWVRIDPDGDVLEEDETNNAFYLSEEQIFATARIDGAHVTGTNGPDVIQITYYGCGPPGGHSDHECDFFNHGLSATVSISGQVSSVFGRVVVYAGGGDDRVTVEIDAGGSPGRHWQRAMQEFMGTDIWVVGGSGDDHISGATVAFGGEGNDTLSGYFDAVDIGLGELGSDGEWYMIAPSIPASFYGGPGDDTIIGAFGENFLDGGDGNDHITVPGNARYHNAGGYSLGGGVFFGGEGNDFIELVSVNSHADGGPGNDVLIAADDTDAWSAHDRGPYLLGGDGDDTLYTGSYRWGNAVLLGEEGDDTFLGTTDNVEWWADGNGKSSMDRFYVVLDGGSGYDSPLFIDNHPPTVPEVVFVAGREMDYYGHAPRYVSGPFDANTLGEFRSQVIVRNVVSGEISSRGQYVFDAQHAVYNDVGFIEQQSGNELVLDGQMLWKFNDLPAGAYNVHASWTNSTDGAPDTYEVLDGKVASDAPYTVYDGTTALETVRVDQRENYNFPRDRVVLPANFGYNCHAGALLGTYKIKSGELVVTLDPSSTGTVVGDAIILEPLFSMKGNAPTTSDQSLFVWEDIPHVFDWRNFPYADADQDPLDRVTILNLPASGQLTLGGVPVIEGDSVTLLQLSRGELVYVPEANAGREDGLPLTSFDFSVSDKRASSDPATMSIYVEALNDAPTITAPSYVDAQGSTVVSGLEFADVDAGTNPVSVTLRVANLWSADASSDPVGTLTVDDTAPGGLSATDITGNGTSDVVLVGSIDQINTTLAAATGLTYSPDALSLRRERLCVSISDQGHSGTDPSVAGLPHTGGDSDEYAYRDIPLFLYTAPTSADSSVTTLENAYYTFQMTNFPFPEDDLDDLSLWIRIEDTSSMKGQLLWAGQAVGSGSGLYADVIANGDFGYLPTADESGEPYTTFTFSVCDGFGHSSPASTMTINVLPEITITLQEDTSFTFDENDFPFVDVSTVPAPHVTLHTLPSEGTLLFDGSPVDLTVLSNFNASDISAGKLVFEPVPDGFGAPYTTFTYSVSDMIGVGSVTMTVNVTPINDVPTTADTTLTVLEDVGYAFTPGDFVFSDADGDVLGSVRILSLPDQGTLTLAGNAVNVDDVVFLADLNAGTFSFTAEPNENGLGYASFDFTVSDGQVDSASSATMAIDVTAINDAPVIDVDPLAAFPMTTEDTRTPIDGVSFDDVDAGNEDVAVTFSVVSGTLDVDDGISGGLTSADITSSGTSTVTLTGTIAEIDTTLASLGLAYTPTSDFHGWDSLNIAIDDLGNAGTPSNEVATASVTISVIAINDPPGLVLPTPPETTPGADVQIDGLSFSDIDALPGDALRVTLSVNNGMLALLAGIPGGVVAGDIIQNNSSSVEFTGSLSAINSTLAASGSLLYTPDLAFAGNDSASVLVNDRGSSGDDPSNHGLPNTGDTTSEQAAAGFTISVGNRPTSQDVTVTTSEDVDYVFTVADFPFADLDLGDSLMKIRINDLPSQGQLIFKGIVAQADQVIAVADLAAGDLVYRPDVEQFGSPFSSFSFSVSDGMVFSDPPNTMTVNVTEVNDPPESLDDFFFAVNDGTPLVIPPSRGLLANDSDVDTLLIKVAAIDTQTMSGEISLWNSDGSFEYLPPAGFVGQEVFTYDLTDGTSTATATVTIDVVAPATVGLLPAADTYVLQAQPSENFGTEAVLQVGYDATGAASAVGLLLFDLTQFRGEVYLAELELHASTLSTGAENTEHHWTMTEAVWDEVEMRWVDLPTGVAHEGDVELAASGLLTIDVTSAIQSALALGTRIVTFTVGHGAGFFVDYDSADSLDPGAIPPSLSVSGAVSPNTPPQAPASPPAFPVLGENVPVGTSAGTIVFSDADGDPVRYAIVSGNGAGAFDIDPISGEITLVDKSRLDADSIDEHNLWIAATDVFGAVSVTAVVLPLGNIDEPPTVGKNVSFRVSATATPGSALGAIPASDPEGQPLTFSIISGNHGGVFSVDGGILRVVNPGLLDPAVRSSYTLQIAVSDAPGPNISYVDVTIHAMPSDPENVWPAPVLNPPAPGASGNAVFPDYHVSHRKTLTFNPAAAYEPNDPSKAAATGQYDVRVVKPDGTYAAIGETVSLDYGSITANGDGTLTYDPDDDLLDPSNPLSSDWLAEPSATGTFRYSLVETGIIDPADPTSEKGIYYGIFDSGGSNSENPLQESFFQVTITNDLPIFRGNLRHFEDDGNNSFSIYPRVKVRLKNVDDASGTEIAEEYRIDVNDFFYDPDGDPVVLDEFFPVSKEAAYTEVLFNGFWTRIQGQDFPQDLNLVQVSDSEVKLYHEISADYFSVVQGSQKVVFPRILEFDLAVTDGQLDDSGAPITFGLTIPVYANTSFVDQIADPAILGISYPYETPYDDSDLIKDYWTLEATTRQPTLDGHNLQSVGGVPVDLNAGTFLRRHALVLDGSGGNSELPLPGLIYDSATVDPRPVVQAVIKRESGSSKPDSIKATLRWMDHDESNETEHDTVVEYDTLAADTTVDSFLVAVRPANPPSASGVYRWELDVELTFGTESFEYETHGESVVVIQDADRSPFGKGWTLDGVPTLIVDERQDMELSRNSFSDPDEYDDRYIISFPGKAPRVFRANPNGGFFSSRVGTFFDSPQEWGLLEETGNEITYTNADGMTFLFEQSHDNLPYVIKELKGPATPPVTFTYELLPSSASPNFSRLTTIEASDGTKTTLQYPSSFEKLANRLTLPGGRIVELAHDHDTTNWGVLEQIRHINQWFGTPLDSELTTPDSVRNFGYSEYTQLVRTYDASGKEDVSVSMVRLVSDEWHTDTAEGSVPERVVEFRYYHHNLLGKVIRGRHLDTDSSTEEQETSHFVVPVASVGIHETFDSDDNDPPALSGYVVPDAAAGTIRLSVDDLEGFEPHSGFGRSTSTAGTSIQELTFDTYGNLLQMENSFEKASDSAPTSLGGERWEYGHLGQVQAYVQLGPKAADPADRITRRHANYYYDYELPLAYDNESGDLSDADDLSPAYDPTDYRGNLVATLDVGGISRFEFETDNEKGLARGKLTRVVDSGGVETKLEYDDQGRLTKSTILRRDGSHYTDTWVYAPQSNVYMDTVAVLKSHTGPLGLVTGFLYDSARRLEQETMTDAGGRHSAGTSANNSPVSNSSEVRVTTYGYSTFGFLEDVEVQDPQQHTLSTTEYVYDAVGFLRQLQVTEPDASAPQLDRLLSTVQYEYEPDGLRSQVIDGNDVVTTFDYDRRGLLIESTRAAQETHYAMFTGTYGSIEQNTKYEYYQDGSLKSVTLPDDIQLLRTAGTDSAKRTNTRAYYRDPAAREAWVVSEEAFAGDSNPCFGWTFPEILTPSLDTDFDHEVLHTKFDLFDRVIEEANWLQGETSSYEYGDARHDSPTVVKQTIHRWSQDGLGDLDGPASNADLITLLAYDQVGNQVFSQTGNSPARLSEFDGLGYLKRSRVASPLGAEYEYTTDPLGNVLRARETRKGRGGVSDPSSAKFVTHYAYDQQGRLLELVEPIKPDPIDTADPTAMRVTSFDYELYDVASGKNRSSRTTNADGVASIVYFDGLGRVVSEINAFGGETKVDFDAAGNLIATEFTPKSSDALPGRKTQYEYDGLNRLRMTQYFDAAGNADHFDYVDYYDSTFWDVITFQGIEGKPGYEPGGQDELRLKATKLRQDSRGNPILVQYPYEGTLAEFQNETSSVSPMTVYSYSRVGVPAAGDSCYGFYSVSALNTVGLVDADDDTFLELEEKVAEYVDADGNVVDVPGMTTEDKDYAKARATRHVYNSAGTLLVAGEAFPASYDSLFVDLGNLGKDLLGYSGFLLQTRNYLDEQGRVDSSYDAFKRTAKYVYDDHETGLGLVLKNGVPTLEKQVTNTYDSAGNPLSITDATGEWLVWEYDGLGRIITETATIQNEKSDTPSLATRTWTYPSALESSYENRNGWVVSSVLDSAALTRTETTSKGGITSTTTTYQLHSDGSLDQVNDAWATGGDPARSGFTSSADLDYDEFGRPTSTTRQHNFMGRLAPASTLVHAYYPNGIRQSTTLQLDGVDTLQTTYTVNNLNRVTRVHQAPLGATTFINEKYATITYNADGSFDTITRGVVSNQNSQDQVFTQFSETSGFLSDGTPGLKRSVDHKYPSTGAIIASELQSRTPDGLLREITRQLGRSSNSRGAWHEVLTLKYDEGQLTSIGELRSDPGPGGGAQREHWRDVRAYDAAGNQSDTPIGRGNRLLEDAENTYKYDDEGNLLEKTRKIPTLVRLDNRSRGPQGKVEFRGSWTEGPGNVSIGEPSAIQKIGKIFFVVGGNAAGSAGGWSSATAKFADIMPGTYDIWTTWKPIVNGGSGLYKTRVEGDEVGSQDTVGFYFEPKSVHVEDGFKWTCIATVEVTQRNDVYVTLTGHNYVMGATLDSIAFDALKLTPHVVRETYTWDHANRLQTVQQFDAAGTMVREIHHGYDVLSQPVARQQVDFSSWDGQVTTAEATARVFDGAHPALDLRFVSNDATEIERNYFRGPGGQLLAVDAGDPQNSQVVWQLADLSGDIRSVGTFDAAGKLSLMHREFAQFGELNAEFGNTKIDVLSDSPVIWSGVELDEPLGLYAMGSRWYDPHVSRYVNPTLGTLNPYRFAGNNPLGNTAIAGPRRVATPGTDPDVFWSALASNYSYYLNPMNNDPGVMGNVFMGGKFVGWTFFAVGTAGAGILGGGAALSTTVGVYTAYTLSTLGGTSGIIAGAMQTRAANPNAGFHEYAFSMGLGGAFGGLLPGSGFADLGGTLGGGVVGAIRSDDQFFGQSMQWGGLVGSLAGAGVDDAVRALPKYDKWQDAAWHATRFMGVAGGISATGGVTAYKLTGSSESALFWANMSSMAGNIAAARLVPCFVAGTPILTPDGDKPIEQLRPGDVVLSRDEHDVDGPVEPKVIEECFERAGEIVQLTISGRLIETTPEHPFYIREKGWTPAGQLELGDEISTPDARWLPITDIQRPGQFTTVYNFRVADYHTYFVGAADWGFGVWVHNAYNPSRNARLTVDEAIENGELSVLSAHRAGVSKGSNFHEHHIFPQEYRRMFAKRGIDVDDFVVDVEVALHRAIHGGSDWRLARQIWEGEWNARIVRQLRNATRRNGGQLTPSQIQRVGEELAQSYGIGTNFHRYTNAAKQ